LGDVSVVVCLVVVIVDLVVFSLIGDVFGLVVVVMFVDDWLWYCCSFVL
jgi:hypothetical protein